MKLDNILFPVDFSDSCTAVKTDVEWLARKFNSTVTLLYVFEVPPAWYGMGDAYALNSDWLAQIMEEAKKRLDAFEIDVPAAKVKRVLLEGRPAAEIYNWCKTHDVDMVAMATHGHGAFEGLMMGSVTAKILHSVNLPLWLRPLDVLAPLPQARFQIVCGLDLGDETLGVLLCAKELAKVLNADVTLVHSVPEEETRPNKYLDFDLHNVLKGIAEKEIAAYQRKAGTSFPVAITGLGIGSSLARTAADKNANMVLIGRGHSRKFLGRFRTHTLDLLGHASCPVLSYAGADVKVKHEEPIEAALAV